MAEDVKCYVCGLWRYLGKGDAGKSWWSESKWKNIW